jgi:hypothetical protein
MHLKFLSAFFFFGSRFSNCRAKKEQDFQRELSLLKNIHAIRPVTVKMHEWRTSKMRRGLWFENPKERDHLEDIGFDGRVILKGI